MVRLFAFLIGLFMSGWLLVSAGVTLYGMISDPAKPSVQEQFHKEHKHIGFAHDGPFGRYDKAQLQRGLKVYQEVCAACHSLSQVAFRDFAALGYDEAEVKALAKGWKTEVPSINPQTGEASTRPALPADKLPSPTANETAARAANNGAAPPDLSLITKSREGGAAYVYSILTGYQAAPANLPKEARPDATHHYNPYFASLNIAMPEPLTADGQVTYDDKVKPTKKQMATDVSAFLTWAAEPKADARKAAGWAALAFLLIFTILCWFSYQNIWADKKH